MTEASGNGRLAGKAAILFGGGGAICGESALRMARDGAAVLLADLRQEPLDAARAMLLEAVPGARVELARGDARKTEDVQAALDQAFAMRGRLDIIVAGVGGGRFLPILMHDVESFLKIVHVNLVPAFLVIRLGAPLMERGGSIVCISSNAAGSVTPWMAPYMVGKGAVEQLVRAAAEELGAAGIRVNAVRPGLTMTEQGNSSSDNPKVVEAVLPEIPLGRIGRPADAAAAIRYLAGPESSWVTGQAIGVDGGGLLRKNPPMLDALKEMLGEEAVATVLRGKVP